MRILRLLCTGLAVGLASLAPDPATARDNASTPRAEQQRRSHHARPQRGTASYYGRQFNGRRMANGERFNPRSNTAAHRTLPLGTVARVTNLQNGRSETVTVRDRGPAVQSRVIDLAPAVAENLGMREQGVAPVEVAPIAVPQSGGEATTAPAGGGGRD